MTDPVKKMSVASGQDTEVLYGNFAFFVQFVNGPSAWQQRLPDQLLGAFSEVSGIEASMEHKVVRQGGNNYGSVMLAGPVTFGTVILKRGVARSQALWRWWANFAGADDLDDGFPTDANRCDVLIGLITPNPKATGAASDGAGRGVGMGWRLQKAMPVKFRVGDLNAKGSDVAIEELHLVHEGLHVAGVTS
jgi:phage tail-like protein